MSLLRNNFLRVILSALTQPPNTARDRETIIEWLHNAPTNGDMKAILMAMQDEYKAYAATIDQALQHCIYETIYLEAREDPPNK